MKKQVALYAIVAAALVAAPAAARAEDSATNKPAALAPKKHGGPFHGKVTAVDATAMTMTIKELTLNITSETKITKEGKPATLSDITVGESVGGTYRKNAEGKLNATVIRIVAKKKTAE
ncbi:MAG TPA: hypothetical protein VGI63_08040 [Verrucomicrobiae bacterium]|jgi:hypothetical protein